MSDPTKDTKGEKPKGDSEQKGDGKAADHKDTKGEKPKGDKLGAGFVRVRTEHPKRFNHVACYGLTFGPEPKTFAPGELSDDALARLKLDSLLVVEEG